ncbi:GntR family transcriptional regulator [Occallatibacter riparius]|uniref:GntR family transcriptional regulator n=1 Tax=Occallatibacter riparius TaxID=1002689 RepID=A0A9J7BLY8_9BACT|nr:GntR family transcriptional regulator [Occallatibacter riparius]UWZ83900.1 GntR family transcriptional regulator [Occallatibacter riparius]
MRIWLNRSGEISLREQLITQVRLGILCRELKPGERLPSTRELARRFGIHANTASAAYRELEQDGWLEFRHGSGVYVRASRPAVPKSPELALEFNVDELIGELVRKARRAGASAELIRARMQRWMEMEPPGHWLVIEPDEELRRIVITEMEQAVRLPVLGCAPAECAEVAVLRGAMPVVLPSKAAMVRKLLPAGAELTVLEVHPVAPELSSYLPAPAGVLVGIASRWVEFQNIAHVMLIAVGIAPESLIVCDAAKPGWKRGLAETAAVVCDAVTCPELPKGCRAIEFRLLAEKALETLRAAEPVASRPVAL